MGFNRDNTENQTNGDKPAEAPRNESLRSSGIPSFSPFGNLGRGGLLGQVVSETDSSAKFTTLMELLRKGLEGDKAVANSIDLIPLPRETHTQLQFSAVVVVRNTDVPLAPDAPKIDYVTAQVLLIEASNDKPRPYQEGGNNRGSTYTVTPTSDEAYNPTLVSFVKQQLLAKYPGQRIVLADGVVIPTEFDTADPASVKRLLSTTTTAVNTVALQSAPGFTDWNLAVSLNTARNNRLELPVQLDFGDREPQTVLGTPVHADVTIEVGVDAGERARAELNDGSGYSLLCGTMVAVELVPVPEHQLEESSRVRFAQPPRAAWAPRLNIVGVNQHYARTTGGVLFAAASVAELNRDRLWAQAFCTPMGGNRQRGGGNEPVLNDIGALNIEANVQGDTDAMWGLHPHTARDNTFGHRDLGSFLDLTVVPHAMIAIDCPVAGPQSYYTSPFATAVRGGESEKRAALDDIIRSARDLTDNNIDAHMDLGRHSNQLFAGDGEVLHLGYWTDIHQRRRDLREFTYLSVANLIGETNPEVLSQWNDTWLRTDISEGRRLADRLELLKVFTNGSLVLQGLALRVTFGARFIPALTAGISDTGAPLINRTGDEGDIFTHRRATMSYMEDAVIQGNTTFSRGRRSDFRGDRSSGWRAGGGRY